MRHAGVLCNYNAGPAGKRFGNSGVTNTYSGRQRDSSSSALRALERDGLVRTLAEPNLTAVSGETAKFLAGGEYPDPGGRQPRASCPSPTRSSASVSPSRRSSCRRAASASRSRREVSELTNDGAVVAVEHQIPALKKRQAKSTVELPSGGSLAIAGLISDDTRQNIDGFPGLKDVPVIGTLFRSRDFIKQETELVVIVTPYMVRPTARQNLARPDDGLAPASDRKANFLGHLNRIYGKGSGAAARRPEGRLRVHRRIAGPLEEDHEISDRTRTAPASHRPPRDCCCHRVVAVALWPAARRARRAGCARRRLDAGRPLAAPPDHGVAAAGDA